jgi:hypothetical protein
MKTTTGDTTLYQIDVCVDCVQVLANGVENDEQARAAEGMARNWPDGQLVLGCAPNCCGEDSSPWFSWQSCEGCGSPLGGDRMHATWFPPDNR